MNMEEEILEMISEHNFSEEGTTPLAKVIADHFREFIEWKDDNPVFLGKDKYLIIIDRPDDAFNIKEMTLVGIYQHWIDNIKEK